MDNPNDPGDVRTDLPNQRTGDEDLPGDLPEDPGAAGDHMPEGRVRDEDDDLSSTPID